jgi:F-type H+-transporting ATPase subunit delta
MTDRISGYVDALLAVTRAEGNTERVQSELVAFADAVAGNDQLRTSLSDPLLPGSVKEQIVTDVLGGRASETTRALLAMVVAAGRGAELGEIIDGFAAQAAAERGRRIATVRSAVPLSADQQVRLANAIGQAVGSPVELQVTVDPSVVGGAITTIGDTVIDGSIRSRLNKMRDAL